MGTNTVPLWPPYKRPDMERDKYGPLPKTDIPRPVKVGKAKFIRDPRTQPNIS